MKSFNKQMLIEGEPVFGKQTVSSKIFKQASDTKSMVNFFK